MDRFPLGAHFVESVDETSTLRLSMLQKLSQSLVDTVRPVLRQLHTDSCCFSYTLAPPLMVLHKRLRPSNFLVLSQKSTGSLGDMLLRHLLWHAPFAQKEQVAAFVANCRDDLRSILLSALDVNELSSLRPFWDGCALLALPDAEAVTMLAALRQVARCSPARALQSVQSEDEPQSRAEDDFEPLAVGEVLRQRRADIFAAAGIKDLSVPDAITVLGKRPELTGSLSDLQDSQFGVPLGVLQDLVPVPGLAQLGAGALQQLHSAPLPSAALASSAAAAAGAAQAAATQARKAQETFKDGAAELRSLMPSRLLKSVGQVASIVRPLSSGTGAK